VAHQVGRAPSEAIQYGGDVGHGLGDSELALLSGWRETPLLEGRHLVLRRELLHSIVEIAEVHARTTVNRQHSRPRSTDPT